MELIIFCTSPQGQESSSNFSDDCNLLQNYEKQVKTVMLINFANINKTKSPPILSEITEKNHKK